MFILVPMFSLASSLSIDTLIVYSSHVTSPIKIHLLQMFQQLHVQEVDCNWTSYESFNYNVELPVLMNTFKNKTLIPNKVPTSPVFDFYEVIIMCTLTKLLKSGSPIQKCKEN